MTQKMTRKEAAHVLECGAWWDYLPDDMSDADMNPLQDALDVALDALRADLVDTEKHFEPGQEVWIVERDEDGEACEVGGYVFLAEVAGYAILSPYVNDHGDLEYLLDYHRRDTCTDYDADLPVAFLGDCYPSQEAAHRALDEEVGEDDC